MDYKVSAIVKCCSLVEEGKVRFPYMSYTAQAYDLHLNMTFITISGGMLMLLDEPQS